MQTMKKQHGMSMLSWIAVISLAILLGTAALRLIPVYLEFYSIVSILDDMQKDKSLQGASKQTLNTTFTKRLDINNIRNLKKGDYKVSKVKGKNAYAFQLSYEVRRSLVGNLSLVATFNRSVEVGG